MKIQYTLITVAADGSHYVRAALDAQSEIASALRRERATQANGGTEIAEFIIVETTVTSNGVKTFIERQRL